MGTYLKTYHSSDMDDIDIDIDNIRSTIDPDAMELMRHNNEVDEDSSDWLIQVIIALSASGDLAAKLAGFDDAGWQLINTKVFVKEEDE